MKVIALTGGIGAGKSTVSNEFAKLGAEVLDSDKISREIMMPCKSAYNEVVRVFGNGILREDNTIDRKKLGDVVFSDDKALRKLNDITHRLIYEEIKRRVDLSSSEVICIEIPLLFTTECPLELDAKIAVISPIEKRIERVMARDGASKSQVEARIAKQLTDFEIMELADVVIENNGDMSALSARVSEVYDLVLNAM